MESTTWGKGEIIFIFARHPRDLVTQKTILFWYVKVRRPSNKKPESLSTPSPNYLLMPRHCAGLLKYRRVFTLFCKATHRDYLIVFAGYCDIFSNFCKMILQVLFCDFSKTIMKREKNQRNVTLYKAHAIPSHSCMLKFNRPRYCCSHKFLRARRSSLALASWDENTVVSIKPLPQHKWIFFSFGPYCFRILWNNEHL